MYKNQEGKNIRLFIKENISSHSLNQEEILIKHLMMQAAVIIVKCLLLFYYSYIQNSLINDL